MSDHQAGNSEAQTPMLDRVGKRKWGYNVAQVDEFLNNAHRLYEQQQPALTQEEVQLATFDLERGGYVMAQVDAVLIRLGRAVANKRTRWEISQQGLPAWMKDTRALALTLQPRAEAEPGLRFKRAIHGKPAYDVAQVDSLVDNAWGQISREMDIDGAGQARSGAAHSSQDANGPAKKTTSSEVLNAIFTQRKGKKGYDEASVNAYLNRVVQVLTRLESLDRLGIPGADSAASSATAFMPASFGLDSTSSLTNFSPNFAADVYAAPSDAVQDMSDAVQDMSATTVIAPNQVNAATHAGAQNAGVWNSSSQGAGSATNVPPADPFAVDATASDAGADSSQESHPSDSRLAALATGMASTPTVPEFAAPETAAPATDSADVDAEGASAASAPADDDIPSFAPASTSAPAAESSAEPSVDSSSRIPLSQRMMAPLMESAKRRAAADPSYSLDAYKYHRPAAESAAPSAPADAIPSFAPAATASAGAAPEVAPAPEHAPVQTEPAAEKPVDAPAAQPAEPAQQPAESAYLTMPPAVRAMNAPAYEPAPVVASAPEPVPVPAPVEETKPETSVPEKVQERADDSFSQSAAAVKAAADDADNADNANASDQKSEPASDQEPDQAPEQKPAISEADSYLNQLMNTSFTPTGSFDIPPLGFDNSK